MRFTILAILLLVTLLALPAYAVTLIHNNDWEGNSYTREGVSVGWSGANLWPEGGVYRISTTPLDNRHFLGSYTANSEVYLNLSSLPTHTSVSISFDLYVIGSWDGNYGGGYPNCGPDEWFLSGSSSNGWSAPIWWSTFSNQSEYSQSFPDYGKTASHPAQTGAIEINDLGYSLSAIYHIERTVSHSVGDIRLFMMTQLGHDFCQDGTGRVLESWGLDNLIIETSPTIPEPTGLLALGGGMVGLASVLRRRKK